MVRLFHVYYPMRTLVLFAGEALLVVLSFTVATFAIFRDDAVLILNYEGGYYKIAVVTAVALLCSHYFDLYETQRLASKGEIYFRLLVVLGVLSFLFAGAEFLFPGQVLQNGIALLGLFILTGSLLMWRAAYAWLLRKPILRERVYVLGGGERASRVVEAMRNQPELGLDVVGWAGAMGNGSLDRDEIAEMLMSTRNKQALDRIIIAMKDRRGRMPVRELLDLRISGVKVEDATSVLEKVSGKIEVDELQPSWLIFSEGFRINHGFLLVKRVISVIVGLGLLLVFVPILPLIALAVRLSSPGPIFYGQKRVGYHGRVFTCWKFRTMRQDAESNGAQWAKGDDPRVTRMGKYLRTLRLDEIPQIWNVLRGDMGFVGPRPERPEFVDWLSKEIPYYNLRHIVPPGLTGWAQVCYPYGASMEESKEKLRYDLYYIKNIAPMFDLLIVFKTIKIVLLGRGSR